MAFLGMKWPRRDDPNILPFRVRRFATAHWLVGSLGVWWLWPDWAGASAYAGVWLGMCGAAFLWWEADLPPHEVTALTNVMINAGESPNLTKSERRGVYHIGLLSLFLAILISLVAWHVYEQSQNGWRFAVQLELCLAFFIVPPVVYYLLIKKSRDWFYKQAEGLRPLPIEDQEMIFKRHLRLLGFIFLYFAGLLQIPEVISLARMHQVLASIH
jgi:hypothetical protein